MCSLKIFCALRIWGYKKSYVCMLVKKNLLSIGQAQWKGIFHQKGTKKHTYVCWWKKMYFPLGKPFGQVKIGDVSLLFYLIKIRGRKTTTWLCFHILPWTHYLKVYGSSLLMCRSGKEKSAFTVTFGFQKQPNIALRFGLEHRPPQGHMPLWGCRYVKETLFAKGLKSPEKREP